MIISKTPLRMSFVGGGSDIEAFYKLYGGAVLSTSIDKFIYINVNKKFDSRIRLAYSKVEDVQSVNQIEHKLVKATLLLLKIEGKGRLPSFNVLMKGCKISFKIIIKGKNGLV